MDNLEKIQYILSNEDLTRLAVVAYLLSGEDFWTMLQIVTEGDGDIRLANDRLKQIINDNQQ